MSNYENSKIYKIYSILPGINEFYVGSSADFLKRCILHHSDCANINSPRYCYKVYNYIRTNGGFSNFIIKEIEDYKCNNRTELNIREEYWKNELNPTLNQRKAHITEQEHKQYKKEYGQRDNMKQYQKQYQKRYSKQIITCSNCGKKHSIANTTNHQKTGYCRNFQHTIPDND